MSRIKKLVVFKMATKKKTREAQGLQAGLIFVQMLLQIQKIKIWRKFVGLVDFIVGPVD